MKSYSFVELTLRVGGQTNQASWFWQMVSAACVVKRHLRRDQNVKRFFRHSLTGSWNSCNGVIPGSRDSPRGVPTAAISPYIYYAIGRTKPTRADPRGNQFPGVADIQVSEDM